MSTRMDEYSVPKTPARRQSRHEKQDDMIKIDVGYPTLQLSRVSSREDPLVFQNESRTLTTFKVKSQQHTANLTRSLHSKPPTSTGFASLSSACEIHDRAVIPTPSTTEKQESGIPLSGPRASVSLKGAFSKMFSTTTSSEQNAATGPRSASRQSQRVSVLPSHIHVTKVTPSNVLNPAKDSKQICESS